MRQWFRIAFPKNYLDRRKRAGFLFVLPALLFFGSVFILPLAQSIMYSFYKIAPGGAREFVGLRLYEKVLTDSTFWTAVGNTIQLLTLLPCLTTVIVRSPSPRSQPDHHLWGATSGLPCTSCPSPPLVCGCPHLGNGSTTLYVSSNAPSFSAFRPRSGCRVCSRCAAIAAVSVWVRIGFDIGDLPAALQRSWRVYEAARIDGANAVQRSGTSPRYR
jgi:hypothetical protein